MAPKINSPQNEIFESNESSYHASKQVVPSEIKENSILTDKNRSKIDFDSVKKFWEEKEGKTRKKFGVLTILIGSLIFLTIISIQYIQKPEPLPDMLPVQINMNYPPHFLFSIYGINQPIGIAVSQDGNRIYATESGGESLIYLFDRDGNMVESFYVPFLQPGERSPVYITIAPDENIYVTDRLQHSIFIFTRNGNYLDSLVGPGLTMSEYINKHSPQNIPAGSEISYSRFKESVTYKQENGSMAELPLPDLLNWAPLGIHFTKEGNLLLTDVTSETHSIIEMDLPTGWVPGLNSDDFNPTIREFGEYGQDVGQFIFPNQVVEDSQDRLYVSDGNNSRVSIWDKDGHFLKFIGGGTSQQALDLPRGMFIDRQDRLFVVDAVNQCVKVFNVSGDIPEFLYSFGNSGTGDGQFYFPNDISMDRTGRIYIADRENNRISVWSY